MNRSTVALALGLAFASLGLGPAAHAQDARLTSRIAPITFQFLALQRFDLSRFNTASRNQWPTGDCVGFSHMAAIEARFNHKYCESGALNAFRLDGYCARFDAYSRTPFFVFGAYANTWSDNYLASLKELDLSEQYYIHRVFTQSTASAGSARDTLSSYNFGDRSIPDTNVLMATQSLSEERHAPFINDASFYGATGVAASINTYLSPTNFAQSKVDQSEFAETLFPSILPGSMVQRVSIPLAARTNARFKVLDIYHGKLAAVGDAYYRTQFIERAIYGGYEIALHGCQPGHSMLLVGFDRVQKLFYFKDHYRRWVTVPYATALNADSYTVVLDVDYEATPAKEEMWLGVWEVDLDGRVGQLTLRRTRQPTNSVLSIAPATNNFFDRVLPEMPKDKWARVGSYLSGGRTYRVLGRLGTDGDDGTIELAIDWATLDGGASTVAEHRAGFAPTAAWQVLRMNLAAAGPGAGAYATGETSWQHLAYGVLMRRVGHTELGSVPHVVDNAFSRQRWNSPLRLSFQDGTRGNLYPNVPASGAAIAWYWDEAAQRWILLQGWVTQDNAILFYTDDPYAPWAIRSLRLLMHTWERGVVSGLDNEWHPVFGAGL